MIEIVESVLEKTNINDYTKKLLNDIFKERFDNGNYLTNYELKLLLEFMSNPNNNELKTKIINYFSGALNEFYREREAKAS